MTHQRLNGNLESVRVEGESIVLRGEDSTKEQVFDIGSYPEYIALKEAVERAMFNRHRP